MKKGQRKRIFGRSFQNTIHERSKMPQINVCHVAGLYRPYFAGHAIYLERAFKYLAEQEINNIVLTTNYDDFKEMEIIDGIRVHRVRMRREWKKQNLRFTFNALKTLYNIRKEIDIIHLHGLWDIYGLFTIFAKIFRKKIILHMVLFGSDDPSAIYNSYKLMKWRFKLLALTDAFISISTPISNSYRQTTLPLGKLHQIPQGVDVSEFNPVSEEEKKVIKKELALREDVNIVTFVGAIIKRKGVDTLIDAWLKVDLKLKNVILLLIGPDTFDGFDGSNIQELETYLNSLKMKIQENGLSVKFIGRSDCVQKYLKASEIFVLPSRYEGFPNTIVEAMSTGLPVILTEIQGVAHDFIKDGVEGFIVKDSSELAERIIYLLNNNGKIIEMGRKGRERATTVFAMRNICNQYKTIYQNAFKK